jgi:hypothetical protein
VITNTSWPRSSSSQRRRRGSLNTALVIQGPYLRPILETIGSLTQRIWDYDRQLQTICQEQYPEMEDPSRFAKSRMV